VGRESDRPRGRSARGAQHLRDISHLYLSGGRAAREQAQRPRARFLVGLVTAADTIARADLCANLALQYARLGQRTLVVDVDPRLPNVGYCLGLPPLEYLAHHCSTVTARVCRAALGVRVVEGVASDATSDLSAEIEQEWHAADCVLLNLPDDVTALDRVMKRFRGHAMPDAPEAPQGEDRPAAAVSRRRTLGRTTMARAGASSRMFGTWLETARRPASPQKAPPPDEQSLAAILLVQDEDPDLRTQESLRHWRSRLEPVPVHLVRCASGSESARDESRPVAWATWNRPLLSPAVRQPLSLLYPEHVAVRRLEGMAQSLLASSSQRGGARVRTL
jgi:hypothetical protein